MLVNQTINQFRARNKRLRRKNINYQEFLESSHWIGIRTELRKKENFKKCKVCFSEKQINMHHVSYTRMFRKLSIAKQDIIPLCQECHYAIHNLCREKNYGFRQGIKKYVSLLQKSELKAKM